MRRKMTGILLILLFLLSGAGHLCAMRKIAEISATLRTQAEIETRRTALMVLYQEVLRSVVKQLDKLSKDMEQLSSEPLALELGDGQ